jgi:hypothetical protein
VLRSLLSGFGAVQGTNSAAKYGTFWSQKNVLFKNLIAIEYICIHLLANLSINDKKPYKLVVPLIWLFRNICP